MRQRETGKVTITDSRMTRFWITLEQGVRFVVNCIEQMQGGEIFVPKIPSLSIEALARIVAPGCDVEYIGIRPGEKLHEALISADEARQTLESEGMYIVQPAHPWWDYSQWAGATPVPDGFQYTSDSNPWELSAEELGEAVEGL